MDSQRPVVGLDLDGTLVTCRDKQLYALRQAVERTGIQYRAFDSFWKLKCKGSTTADALCETGVEKDVAENLARRWVEMSRHGSAYNKTVYSLEFWNPSVCYRGGSISYCFLDAGIPRCLAPNKRTRSGRLCEISRSRICRRGCRECQVATTEEIWRPMLYRRHRKRRRGGE